jgi:hypothetical protein
VDYLKIKVDKYSIDVEFRHVVRLKIIPEGKYLFALAPNLQLSTSKRNSQLAYGLGNWK